MAGRPSREEGIRLLDLAGAERLLLYLTPQVALGLLDATAALSPSGSHFEADIVDKDSIVSRNQYLAHMRKLSPGIKRKGARFQFGAKDPSRLLADHGGSTVSILQAGDDGPNFGRVFASQAPADLPLPRPAFVMARRGG